MSDEQSNQPGSEQEPPKIEFPCDYPIKVMGRSTEDFESFVVDTMRKHAGEIEEVDVASKVSRNGKFTSVTVTIVATGKPQLDAIFADLQASGRVQLVL